MCTVGLGLLAVNKVHQVNIHLFIYLYGHREGVLTLCEL